MSGDTILSLYIFYDLLLQQTQHAEIYNRPNNRNQELEPAMQIPNVRNSPGTLQDANLPRVPTTRQLADDWGARQGFGEACAEISSTTTASCMTLI